MLAGNIDFASKRNRGSAHKHGEGIGLNSGGISHTAAEVTKQL